MKVDARSSAQFCLNKTGDSVGNNVINTVLNNLQLTADFAGLLILDHQPHEVIKQNERGCMDKISFKRRNLHSTLPRPQTRKKKKWSIKLISKMKNWTS